jgi:hypothetical protein
MNSSMVDRPRLHVEGKDDFNSIIHLMRWHGVDYDPKPWPAEFPEIKVIGSIEAVLEGMEPAIAASTGKTVGFVLDADSPIRSRWEAVMARLTKMGVAVPSSPSADGFIGESTNLKVRVGVWLMPDNVNDGILEDFLREVIETDDLSQLAASATEEAKSKGAKFRDVDRSKAMVHAWLAWQAEPGLPFGTAIRAKYFRADLPAGKRFATWFRKLYGIP